MRFLLCIALFLIAFRAIPAQADLGVSYLDSSPDWITIRNLSGCDLGPFELVIDLGRSPAGLIFDTSGEGAGYSAYAPLEIVAGAEHVRGLTTVTDGDSRLMLKMDFFGGGARVTLAVDVDDTSASSALGRTIIDGSEIAGAVVEARLDGSGPVHSGIFGTDGVALVPLEACIS